MWPIEGVVQPYAWGDTEFIPRLLGREPDGGPEAELWFGTHPDAPSPVVGEGLLSDHLELPYLVKVLAAGQPLSIQTHPDAEGAAAGFAAEEAAGVPRSAPERTYRDASHKPELICALTPFRAAAGFAEPSVVADRVAALGDAVPEPLADHVRAGDLRAATGWALGEAGDLSATVEAIRAVVEREPCPPALRDVAPGVLAGIDTFGADPGVLVLLLMRHVVLEPGQAIFLPARQLHAYLSGAGVEVMANSNNVVRGGLTPKHVDVDELLRIVHFEPGGIPVQSGGDGPRHRYRVDVDDFAVERILVDGSETLDAAVGPEVVLVTEGEVVVGGHRLRPGRAVCRPPGAEQAELTGSGTAWLVTSAGA